MRWLILGVLLGACDDGGAMEPEDPPPDLGARLDARPQDVGAADAALRDLGPRDLGARDLGAGDAAGDAEAVAELDMAPAPDAAPPGCDEPVLVEPRWRNPFDSPRTAEAGAPHHSVVEPVVNPGAPFELRGKFAYGVFSEDLEGEFVEAWLRPRPCGAWTRLGRETTDSDGRVTFLHPGFPQEGIWDLRLIVPGDESRALGAVRVVPRGRQAVVFDIDGTLTTGDDQLFQELLLGAVPDMYPDADTVVRRWADAGYLVLYMTGRPYFLDPISRAWLAARGFPDGPLRTTDGLAQSLPTADGVQAYKRAWLEHLQEEAGLELMAAYGNSETDICAYAMAGVDPEATWIIGPNGGAACEGFGNTRAVESYPRHLTRLGDLPPAAR